MNYGMYLSASGALTNSYRMDVHAHNLANAQTPAFKPDKAYIQQREPERIEDSLGYLHSNELLERLGGGVFAGPQNIDFSVGTLEVTNRPMDVAINAEDQFFVVQETGADGQVQTSLTKSGKLMVDASGRVVTAAGDPLLNPGGGVIQVSQDQRPRVDFKGQILDQNNQVLGQLRVVKVDDLNQLIKRGQGKFATNAPLIDVQTPTLEPGMIEGSAVDPITALMDLISSTKSVTGNATMMTHQDRMMDRVINTFGRIG